MPSVPPAAVIPWWGYRIENKTLYISDPNYPGDLQRSIRFDASTGKFNPYQSGQNAEEIAAGNSKAYEQIEFTGRTAFVDFTRIGQRWKELQDGRAGNDLFPAYWLKGVDGDGDEIELASGQSLEKATLKINITLADGKQGQARVYRGNQLLAPRDDGHIELNTGRNDLGIVVNGIVDDSPEYIDFVRLTINRR